MLTYQTFKKKRPKNVGYWIFTCIMINGSSLYEGLRVTIWEATWCYNNDSTVMWLYKTAKPCTSSFTIMFHHWIHIHYLWSNTHIAHCLQTCIENWPVDVAPRYQEQTTLSVNTPVDILTYTAQSTRLVERKQVEILRSVPILKVLPIPAPWFCSVLPRLLDSQNGLYNFCIVVHTWGCLLLSYYPPPCLKNGSGLLKRGSSAATGRRLISQKVLTIGFETKTMVIMQNVLKNVSRFSFG